MVDGFLSFRINVPGTGLWKAIRARGVLIDTLMRYCRESKAHMSTGEEPACLLDFWIKEVLQEMEEAAAKGEPAPKHSQGIEIGVRGGGLSLCQPGRLNCFAYIDL